MAEVAIRVDDSEDKKLTAYETALAHCEESRHVYESEQAKLPAKVKSSPELIRLLNRQFSSQPYTNPFIWQHQLNIWVYRCVSVIVGAAKRPEPRLFREWVSKGVLKSEQLPYDHPAVRLLNNPNQYDTWRDLVEKYWTSRELTGMYFLAFDKVANTLDHLRSDRVEIIPEKRKLIAGYRYSVVGDSMNFLPQEVIYSKYWNPDDDWYGLPPLKAAANSIAAHLKASKWNLNFFDNSAMPLGYLKTAYDFSNDQALLKTIQAEWNELYQGYKNFGKTPVLGSDLEWRPLSPTHTEMGFSKLLSDAQREIFAGFGVPNIYGNVLEGMNYANSREQGGILWQTKILPNLKSDQATWEKFFDANYAEKGEHIKMQHDLTGIEELREGVVAEAEASRIYVTSFQRTPNQARARRNEAPEPGGDVLIGPASFVKIDQVGDIFGARPSATGQLRAPRGILKIKSILPDDDKRLAHWNVTKGIITSIENRMLALMTAIVSDWREEMLRNLKADKNIKAFATKGLTAGEIVFDLDEATGMLRALSGPIFEDAAKRGGARVFATADIPGAFDLHDPRVDAKLQAAAQRFKERIGDANWQRVKDSLAEGINNGETSEELAARVNSEMDGLQSNAGTIARTEVLPRYHEGQIEGMRQSGVIERKEWLSAFAERSRDGHMVANGQTVGIDAPFLIEDASGRIEALMYPGDPSGSASNIINCMCDVLPVIEESEE